MENLAGVSGGQCDAYCSVCEVYCIVVPELRELRSGTMWKFRLRGQGVRVMYIALYVTYIALYFLNYGSLGPELYWKFRLGGQGASVMYIALHVKYIAL